MLLKNYTYFLFIVIVLFCLSCTSEDKTDTSKPNILFILADDFGYHDMSLMGSKFYQTPNIDEIANIGIIFTDGYAACQVCSPSRASIMTGTFPARHGITDWIGAKTGSEWRKAGRHNKVLPPYYERSLSADYVTLPEALKEEGYKTFFAGKWHLGEKGSWPEDHGFDINKGGWQVGSPIGGYYAPWENPNLESGPDGQNLSIRLANETVNFIKANKDTSFFAFLSFYAVHGPIQTTKEKWKKYRDIAEENGIAENGFKMGKFLPIRQVQDNPVYAGLVETMDDAIGIVTKVLTDMGLDENTIIVFTSDNGGVAAGDAFATSNKPLRAGKGYQFEGGIREPYFIAGPGINPGTCTTPVSGVDFYPTLLELAGVPIRPHDHKDGVSLVPLINGQEIEKRPLIWHYPHYGNQGGEPSSVIRLGKWKLIHYYEDGRRELYNLEDDLSEENNLASELPDMAADLHKDLFANLKEMGARFPIMDPEYDPNKEKAYLEKVVNERLPNLEKQRKDFLAKDFDPGNKWWGSATKD